jgi:hypothetical protein
MSHEFWVAAIVIAAIASAGSTWWVVRRVLTAEFERRSSRAAATQRDQHRSELESAVHAQKKLRDEVELMRNGSATQIANALAHEKANVARLDARLTMAYAELDRLREKQDGAKPALRASGFADTQVM